MKCLKTENMLEIQICFTVWKLANLPNRKLGEFYFASLGIFSWFSTKGIKKCVQGTFLCSENFPTLGKFAKLGREQQSKYTQLAGFLAVYTVLNHYQIFLAT